MLKAGGAVSERGWDVWIASTIQRTWSWETIWDGEGQRGLSVTVQGSTKNQTWLSGWRTIFQLIKWVLKFDVYFQNIRGKGGRDHSLPNKFSKDQLHIKELPGKKKKNVNTVDWPKIPRKSSMSFQKEVGKSKIYIKRDKVFRGWDGSWRGSCKSGKDCRQ